MTLVAGGSILLLAAFDMDRYNPGKENRCRRRGPSCLHDHHRTLDLDPDACSVRSKDCSIHPAVHVRCIHRNRILHLLLLPHVDHNHPDGGLVRVPLAEACSIHRFGLHRP